MKRRLAIAGFAAILAASIATAAAIASEDPLVPDGPSKAAASAIRHEVRCKLWADPFRDQESPGAGSVRAKYPADGLPRGTATLVVAVVDSAGEPVGGANIRLEPPPRTAREVEYEDQHPLGVTDAAGVLRATDLPAGPVVVCVNPFSRSWDEYDIRRDVELRPSETATVAIRLDRALASSGVVVGRLVDDEGLPLAEVGVSDRPSQRWTETDAEGRFRLDRLPAGRTTLESKPDGCRPVEAAVDVKPHAETTVELRAAYADPGPRVIRGHVVGPRGEPVPGARVWVRRPRLMGGDRFAFTDVRGAFALRRLSHALLAEGVEVGAGAWKIGYERVEIGAGGGAPETDLTLVLPIRYATLAVRVVDVETGLAVRKCLAVAHRGGAGDGAGVRLKAEIRDGPLEGYLESGTYRLTVESPEFSKWEGRVLVSPPPARTTAPEVRLVRRRARVEDVALTVVVKREPGRVEWPKIEVEVFDPSDGTAISNCTYGTRDGRYTLPALSGDWRLRVTGEGYETLERALRLPESDTEATVTVLLRPQ